MTPIPWSVRGRETVEAIETQMSACRAILGTDTKAQHRVFPHESNRYGPGAEKRDLIHMENFLYVTQST